MSEDLQPVNYSSSDGLLEARSNSMGAVHYYQGGKGEIKGEEFAEQMSPGLAEDRKKYLEEHAEEARDWRHREKTGSLINEEGRLLTPEGKLAFPTKKDKAKEIGHRITVVVKNGTEGLKGLSAETKDRVMEALAANQVEEARQMLRNAGVELKEEKPGETKVSPPKGPEIEENPEARRGPAVFTSRKGVKLDVTVIDAFKDSHNGRIYYRAEGRGKDAGKKFNKLNANLVEFEDTSEARTGILENGENKERREFLEMALLLQQEVDKRFKEEAGNTTHVDLNDPSVKSHLLGQIREKVVDEHMQTLPEDRKGDKKLKGRLLDALKKDPDELRSELSQFDGEKKEKLSGNEVILEGEDDAGKYLLKIVGGKVYMARDVNDKWEIAKSSRNPWSELSTAQVRGRVSPIEITPSNGPDSDWPHPSVGGGYEGGGGPSTVEVDTDLIDQLNEADDKLKARKKALWEEYDSASPERQKEIIKEIREIDEDRDKVDMARRKAIDGLPEDDLPDEEVVDEEVVAEEETPKEEDKRPRWRRAWDKARLVAFYPWNAANRYFFLEEDPKKRRRRGLALLAGGILVGALLAKYGFGGHGGEAHEHGVPGAVPGHPVTPEHTHVDLNGINPDTIHAETPGQFQHGVLDLLGRQGVHAHGVTHEKLAHMNRWMEHHQIASGMRESSSGLEQNLTHFPSGGHEFTNADVSADQGFRIGPSGSGRENLDAWVREAERIGIRFNRG